MRNMVHYLNQHFGLKHKQTMRRIISDFCWYGTSCGPVWFWNPSVLPLESDHCSRPVQGHSARGWQGAHGLTGHPQRDPEDRSDLRNQAVWSQPLHQPLPPGHQQQVGNCESKRRHTKVKLDRKQLVSNNYTVHGHLYYWVEVTCRKQQGGPFGQHWMLEASMNQKLSDFSLNVQCNQELIVVD